jgi:hypothetical protein
MWESKSLVNGNSVGDALADVQYYTGSSTGGIQTKYSWRREEKSRCSKCFCKKIVAIAAIKIITNTLSE